MATHEFIGVVVPEHIVDYLTQQEKAKREAEGNGATNYNANKLAIKFVEELLAGYVPASGLTAPVVGEAPAVIDSVERAAEIIVNTLEPEHQNKVRQVAKETGHPLAAYVISPMLYVNDNGAFSTLLGRWNDSVPHVTKAPIHAVTHGQCEFCHQPIVKPVRTDQRFCNMPEDGGDSCGAKWNKANVMPTRDRAALERAYGPQTQLSL